MDTPLVQVFQHAGDPLDKVSDDGRPFQGSLRRVGWDAYFFLLEPLSCLLSDYAVAHWVVWPLCSSPGDADLMESENKYAAGISSTESRILEIDKRLSEDFPDHAALAALNPCPHQTFSRCSGMMLHTKET